MGEKKSERISKQKKQSVFRLLIQCISFAFHNGYVAGWVKGKIYTGDNKMFCVPGLNCYSCPGAIGSCPIGSLQAVLDTGGFNVSLYVIGFIGAVGVFCGRFVCGWLCPFGLVQDLIYRIPFFKKVKNLPGHKYLRYLRFIILAVFVIILPIGIRNQAGAGQPWFCEYICPSGTLLGGIPLTIANAELRSLIGPRFIWKAILLVIILISTLISDRPFCKYICPLGALYGLANPISIYRYKVDRDTCTGCGTCQNVCGGDIRVWEKPNSIDCIRCGKCIAACPTDALSTTFSFKKVYTDADTAKVMSESSVAPDSVAANVKSDSSQKNGHFTSVSKITGGRKIAIVLSGILCLSISIYLLSQIIPMMYLFIIAGSLTNILSFLQYTLSYIIIFVPIVMTLILGLCMFAVVTFKPDLYDRLRAWPGHILKIIAIGFGLIFIGYVIIAILIAGEFSVDVLLYAFMLSFTGIVLAVLLAVAVLIAYLVFKIPSKIKNI